MRASLDWSVNQPYCKRDAFEYFIAIIHSDTRPSSHSPATRTRADRANRSLVPALALFLRPLVTVIREGVICRCLTDGPHKRTRHPQSAQKRELHSHTYTRHQPAYQRAMDPRTNLASAVGQRGASVLVINEERGRTPARAECANDGCGKDGVKKCGRCKQVCQCVCCVCCVYGWA